MKVLGFDVESTGIDINKDVIIEVGAVLFQVDKTDTGYSWQELESFSALVYEYSYPELSDEIKKLTGIQPEELKKEGVPFVTMLSKVAPLGQKADVILAHNKRFDREILASQVKRMGYANEREVVEFFKVPWICSIDDNKFISSFRCKKLSHLALDLGIAVDPATLHRAMDDVRLLGKVMQKIPTDPQDILKYSREPDMVIRAHIKAPWEDGGKGKDEATKLGYSWEMPRGVPEGFKKVEKAWVKKVKESEIEEEIKRASFPVKIVGRV